jgi:hypothetical protein
VKVFVNAYTKVLQRAYQKQGRSILVNSIYPGTKHSKIPQVLYRVCSDIYCTHEGFYRL